MSAILSQEFQRLGHEVVVVTQTPGNSPAGLPLPVVRKPSMRRLLELVRWCDVAFHNNISIRTAWPLVLVRRPWVVVHQTWIRRTTGSLAWQDRLKLLLSARAQNVAISRAIARELPVPCVVIPNPYLADVFRVLPHVRRDPELIFVGRLVSDKGVDLLLSALGKLRSKGLKLRLTIVGDGPERDRLESRARGMKDGVVFTGTRQGEELVKLFNEHQILVVPSLWKEPFGIVAIEAIACGCVVVGSSGGGLPDAMGPCGITFRSGDADDLAATLERVLADEALQTRLRASAPEHLTKHSSHTVAKRYLEVLGETVR